MQAARPLFGLHYVSHNMLVHADACRMHAQWSSSCTLNQASRQQRESLFHPWRLYIFPSSTFVCNLPCKHPNLWAPIAHLQVQAGTAFRTKYRLMMKLTSGEDLSCELVIYRNLRLSLDVFFSKTAW